MSNLFDSLQLHSLLTPIHDVLFNKRDRPSDKTLLFRTLVHERCQYEVNCVKSATKLLSTGQPQQLMTDHDS